MPWKGVKDPYRIWLSEILLQQTRVEQGLPYYHRFLEAFPTLPQLATAADDKVFKLWEGLGYYSRCRNLLAAARTIMDDFKGKFPSDYAAILQLPGVGPYTAAAIASFAFGLPYAVTDGNVIRVLSRFFLIQELFDTPGGQKLFRQTAQSLLPVDDPGGYNQAIMDFGATVCKPKAPLCHSCPLAERCQAFGNDMIAILPAKSKKLLKQDRFFTWLAIKGPAGILVRERTEKDIWRHLYEYPAVEGEASFRSRRSTIEKWAATELGLKVSVISVSEPLFQQLTHQSIHGRILFATTHSKNQLAGYSWQPLSSIHNLAFPVILRKQLPFLPEGFLK